eukprot:TRINITY_DN953_c0_g1_i1.p1 TRINITY_DN953_c0_g1~~TRINITY_DN953_c0_g1_i1.p1  ORF type:complete len:572 (+),score=91.19 TRINITY_DN953_c0_g1_i1:93-1808(+)
MDDQNYPNFYNYEYTQNDNGATDFFSSYVITMEDDSSSSSSSVESGSDEEMNYYLLRYTTNQVIESYGYERFVAEFLNGESQSFTEDFLSTFDKGFEARMKANEGAVKLIKEYIGAHNLAIESVKFQDMHWISRFDYQNRDQAYIDSVIYDFERSAEDIAKIIIQEKNLPNYLRSVKQVDIGGINSRKYMSRGIVFKYPEDTMGDSGSWVFGGSKKNNFLPTKSINNNIKGIRAVYKAVTELGLNIQLPLMCMIHYLGQVVCAVSMVPVSKRSLVYGISGNGSIRISENTRTYDQVLQLADYFKYVDHPVKMKHSSKTKIMFFSAEVEFHYAHDRIYMLGFSRVLPGNNPSQPLAQAFRDEFLSMHDFHLSPDVYTQYDTSESTYRDTADIAIKTLQKFIEEGFWEGVKQERIKFNRRNVKDTLHSNGINLRYMGLLRYHCQDNKYRSAILKEMILRAIKQMLNIHIEKTVFRESLPSYHIANEIIENMYNNLIDKTNPIWCQSQLKKTILDKFGKQSLTEAEKSKKYNLLDSVERPEVLIKKIPLYSRFTIDPVTQQITPVAYIKSMRPN